MERSDEWKPNDAIRASATPACLSLTWAVAGHAADAGCTESAALLRYACSDDLRDDFFSSTAQCLDTSIADAACSGDLPASERLKIVRPVF